MIMSSEYSWDTHFEMPLAEAIKLGIPETPCSVYKIEVGGESYVGFTTQQPQKRLEQHIEDAKNGSKLKLHVALRRFGYLCDFEVIGSYPDEIIGLVSEITNIKKFNATLNTSIGGEGNHYDVVERLNELGEKVFFVQAKKIKEQKVAEEKQAEIQEYRDSVAYERESKILIESMYKTANHSFGHLSKESYDIIIKGILRQCGLLDEGHFGEESFFLNDFTKKAQERGLMPKYRVIKSDISELRIGLENAEALIKDQTKRVQIGRESFIKEYNLSPISLQSANPRGKKSAYFEKNNGLLIPSSHFGSSDKKSIFNELSKIAIIGKELSALDTNDWIFTSIKTLLGQKGIFVFVYRNGSIGELSFNLN